MMKKTDETQSIVTRCTCPYCDEQLLLANFPYCRPCSVSLQYCVTCKIALPREASLCPHCGAELSQ